MPELRSQARKRGRVKGEKTVKLETFDKKGVRMVAHRGLSGVETENTVAAFVAAANRSYYGIETDVHRTIDGKYVCIHDDNTLRVSGVDCKVTAHTYEEVLSVRLFDTEKGTGVRNDLRVPTLADYVSICHRYGKHSVLELKDEFVAKEIEEIIEIVKNAGQLENTTFISFIPSDLIALRKILPSQTAMLLSDTLDEQTKDLLLTYNLDLDILFTALDENGIKWLKSHGKAVNCWTVDKVSDAEKLSELGVDFITTNILE